MGGIKRFSSLSRINSVTQLVIAPWMFSIHCPTLKFLEDVTVPQSPYSSRRGFTSVRLVLQSTFQLCLDIKSVNLNSEYDFKSDG